MAKVIVFDCTEFTQNSRQKYKEIEASEAIPATPELSFSRYEVLESSNRKVHFDFDGLPDTPEGEQIPDRFVSAWTQFMIKSGFLQNENTKYVKTSNHHSTAHEGFSSHVICYEYSMHFTCLKNSIIMFVNSDEGKEFEPYVDTAIYSSLRLFKLPNFIGLPIGNNENYHRLDPNDNNPAHYLIQLTEGTTQIQAHFKIPKTLAKKAKRFSQDNRVFYKQMVVALQELRNVFVEKRSIDYDENELTKKLESLIANENVSQDDKARLQKYLPVQKDRTPIVASLIHLVEQKYNITI